MRLSSVWPICVSCMKNLHVKYIQNKEGFLQKITEAVSNRINLTKRKLSSWIASLDTHLKGRGSVNFKLFQIWLIEILSIKWKSIANKKSVQQTTNWEIRGNFHAVKTPNTGRWNNIHAETKTTRRQIFYFHFCKRVVEIKLQEN